MHVKGEINTVFVSRQLICLAHVRPALYIAWAVVQLGLSDFHILHVYVFIYIYVCKVEAEVHI